MMMIDMIHTTSLAVTEGLALQRLLYPMTTIKEAVLAQNDSTKQRIALYLKIDEINKHNEDSMMDELKAYIISNPSALLQIFGKLIHGSMIRPKQIDSFVNVISKLSQVFGELPPTKMLLEKNTDLLQRLIQCGLFSTKDKIEIGRKIQRKQKKILCDAKCNELQNFLIDDDLDALQQASCSPNFDFLIRISPNRQFLLPKNQQQKNYSLLQLSAFYDSLNCFKYAYLNGCAIEESTCPFAVCGGSIEIIRIVAYNNMNFLNCFRTAMIYHRNYICDWLLLTYNQKQIHIGECIKYHNEPAFFFLLGQGIDIDDTMKGMTSLHFACENGSTEIAKLLISNGANIHAKSSDEKTPLHFACENNLFEIGEILISKGADVQAKTHYNRHDGHYGGYDGQTPLHFACETGSYEMVKLLISKGSDVQAKLEGCDDKTPLHFACDNGSLKNVELLLSNGADIHATTFDEVSPLHCACEGSSLEIVKLLIENGSHINSITRYGKSPLHYACETGSYEISEYLISKGADIKAKTGYLLDEEKDKTPLHYACEAGSIKLVELLISKGADIHAKTSSCKTPLHYALQQGYNDLANYLVSKGSKC